MEMYKDVNAPIKARVEDLLGRMSIEEKIGQLMQLPAKEGIDAENYSNKLEEALKFLHNNINFYPSSSDKIIQVLKKIKLTEEPKRSRQ